MIIVLLPLLVIVGVVFYRVVYQTRTAPDIAWAAGSVAAAGTPGPPATIEVEPRRTFRVAAALSRIEARRVVTSPLIWAGVLLTVPIWLVLLDGSLPDEGEWIEYTIRQIPFWMFPLCGMVLIAVNRAVLRAKRDGVEELFATLPTTRATRTTGHVLALWSPVLVGAVLTGVMFWTAGYAVGKANETGTANRGPLGFGLEMSPADWAYAVEAVLLVACAGVLAIALARLLPWSIVGLAGVVVVGFVTAATNASSGAAWGPYDHPAALPREFVTDVGWWHVVYLVGLGAIAVGVAWLADGARHRGATALAVAAAMIIVGGVGQTVYPTNDEYDALAARVADAETYTECEEIDGVEYCLLPRYLPDVDAWHQVVSGVRSDLPPAVADRPLTLRQQVSPIELALLDDEVRARLDGDGAVEPEVGVIHPDLRWNGGGEARGLLAVLVGTTAVGLPTDPGATGPCFAGGQARLVVALWLAGQPLTDGERDALFTTGIPGEIGEYVDYGIEHTAFLPADWETDRVAAIVAPRAELSVAGELAALPRADVADELARSWDHYTDPATPASDLAEDFGLAAPQRSVVPEGLTPCS